MSHHDVSIEHEPLLRTDPTSKHAALTDNAEDSEQTDSCEPSSVWQQLCGFDGKLRIASIAFCFFVMGLNSTDIGALLIPIETYYDIQDKTAALIFITVMAGSLAGILLLPFVLHSNGWRGLVLIACTVQLAAMLAIAAAPAFPIFLIALFFVGMGMGSLDAGGNAWASKAPSASIVQGILHGSFSVGSILGPIASVGVIKGGFEWYRYHQFLAPLVFAQLVFMTYAFRDDTMSKYRELHNAPESTTGKSASRLKIVYVCGLFYFFYLAIEDSFNNWIPSYMKRIRHVDIATASYASSSFWTGMAIGRFALGPVTEFFGLNTSIASYIILATIFEAIFRAVEHAGLSLALLGIIGFFLAPMYPSAMILIGQKLSMQDYIGGVAAAAAAGRVGDAGSQWLIGFMSEKLGLGHLIDVVLCISIVLLVVWILFSRVR